MLSCTSLLPAFLRVILSLPTVFKLYSLVLSSLSISSPKFKYPGILVLSLDADTFTSEEVIIDEFFLDLLIKFNKSLLKSSSLIISISSGYM